MLSVTLTSLDRDPRNVIFLFFFTSTINFSQNMDFCFKKENLGMYVHKNL